jgi:hypothetical protein
VRVSDDDLSARLEGIAGVDDEVHERLFELGRVGEHGVDPINGFQPEPDVLRDEPPQHRLDTVHELGEVDEPLCLRRRPAEGEELADELGRPGGRVLDLAEL